MDGWRHGRHYEWKKKKDGWFQGYKRFTPVTVGRGWSYKMIWM